MAVELRRALDRHRPETVRRTLAEALGEVTLVKEPDGSVYAELIDPAYRLLIAAGGGVSANGSGGPI